MTSVTRELTIRALAASGGALALTAVLLVGALGSFVPAPQMEPTAQARTRPEALRPPPPPQVSSSPAPETPRLLEGESRTALQGDEVSDAVATYGIDGAGNLYEVHSPQTEVPQLGRPTT